MKYLFAMDELGKDGGIRSSAIAEILRVSKPSVHRMLEQMTRMDLVRKEKYSCVEITETGRALLQDYHEKWQVVHGFFQEKADLPDEICRPACLALLCELESGVLDSFCRLVQDGARQEKTECLCGK